MARLKQPPRKVGEGNLSPPPLTAPPATTDAEAASQQLLAEDSQSANSKHSSSILGANLLNAARTDVRQSSPKRMAHKKAANGKLSRVSSLARLPRQHVARREDVWDDISFPEKTTFRSQGTIDRLGGPTIALLTSSLPQISLDPEGFLDEADPDVMEQSEESSRRVVTRDYPELPDRSVLPKSNVQIEEYLLNGKQRCSATTYRYDKSNGPRYGQCQKAGTNNAEHGFRCNVHLHKPGAMQCDYETVLDTGALQCHAPGVDGTTRCSRHAGLDNEDSAASQSNLALDKVQESHHDEDIIRTGTKRNSGDGNISNGKLSKPTKKQRPAMSDVGDHEDEQSTKGRGTRANKPMVDSGPRVEIQVQKRVPETSGKRTRMDTQVTKSSVRNSSQKISGMSQEPIMASNRSKEALGRDDDGFHGEESQNAEHFSDEDEPGVVAKAAKKSNFTSSTLVHVFKYLDLKERSGSCQTKQALSIKRCCDRTSNLLDTDVLPIEDIIENIGQILEMLKKVGEAEETSRLDLKQDIYAYVFRSLTCVLQSLYTCLAATEDGILNSLSATRVMFSFVHGIIALRDEVGEWKISVPQRYRGYKLIQEVNSSVIVPLRTVEKRLIQRISQLEYKERERDELAEIERETEQEKKEFAEREGRTAAMRERWKRWQELHIVRMQCEPDPRKRRKLFITKIEDLEEKDSNGVHFERVPIFGNRNAPPLNSTSSMSHETWSDKEATALLEGLERFAGPHVFQEIFKAYCRPGGPLRDLSVTSIAIKASWVRSSWAKLQHEQGWQMPVWVKQIPTLP